MNPPSEVETEGDRLAELVGIEGWFAAQVQREAVQYGRLEDLKEMLGVSDQNQ